MNEQLTVKNEDNLTETAQYLYDRILECLNQIDITFETLSRLLYQFVKEPRLLAAKGWETPYDIFQEPEIRAKMDRMRINSPAQFFRWKRLASLDDRVPEFGVLTYDKLSVLSSSGKIQKLEELADKVELGDMPKQQAAIEAQVIMDEQSDKPKEDIPPFEIKGDVGYWKDKAAIRFTGRGVASLRLRSKLLHLPIYFKFNSEDFSIFGYNDDDGQREAVVLSTDPEFLEYISRKLHTKVYPPQGVE